MRHVKSCLNQRLYHAWFSYIHWFLIRLYFNQSKFCRLFEQIYLIVTNSKFPVKTFLNRPWPDSSWSIIPAGCIHCWLLVWSFAQVGKQPAWSFQTQKTPSNKKYIGQIPNGEKVSQMLKRFLLEWVWRTPSDEGKQLIVIGRHQSHWCPPHPPSSC